MPDCGRECEQFGSDGSNWPDYQRAHQVQPIDTVIKEQKMKSICGFFLATETKANIPGQWRDCKEACPPSTERYSSHLVGHSAIGR